MRIRTFCYLAALAIPLSALGGPKAKEFHLNGRAFECEAFEFAELDSMKRAELENSYCSTILGWQSAKASHEEMFAMEKQQNFRFGTAYSQKSAAKMESCSSLRSKIATLYTRKFSAAPKCDHAPPLPRDPAQVDAQQK